MKKQTSSLPQVATPFVASSAFGKIFLIKGDKLSPESDIPEKSKPLLIQFKSEQELNRLILTNRAVLFGKETVGLTAKIGQATFPFDAFMFDFSNREDPRCFLLITPKDVTTSMLGLIAVKSYLQAIENRVTLLKMLSDYIRKDKTAKKIFSAFLIKGQTMEAILEYVIRKRLRALFLATEVEPESMKLFTSYIEAHSDVFDIIELRKYKTGKNHFLSMLPAFDDLTKKEEVTVRTPKEKIVHTEDHHFLKGSAVARTIYEKLKAEAVKTDKSIVFNPKGKHYVSMKKGSGKNLAFFHFRKTSIYLVVMLEEKLVRKMVKKAVIKTLPPSVQSFWNGASTGLVISSAENLKEISEVLKKIIKQ